MLTVEDRKATRYSRDRLKLIKKGDNSPDVDPYYNKKLPENQECAALEALEKLATAQEQWVELTSEMPELEAQLLARDAMEGHPKIKSIIKEIDLNGLGLKMDKPPSKLHQKKRKAAQLITDESDCPSSDDSPLKQLINNNSRLPAKSTKRDNQKTKRKYLSYAKQFPNKVEIYRKVINRKSGKPLYKRFNKKLTNFSEHTATFDKKLVIRISDLCIKILDNFKSLLPGPKLAKSDKQTKEPGNSGTRKSGKQPAPETPKAPKRTQSQKTPHPAGGTASFLPEDWQNITPSYTYRDEDGEEYELQDVGFEGHHFNIDSFKKRDQAASYSYQPLPGSQLFFGSQESQDAGDDLYYDAEGNVWQQDQDYRDQSYNQF